MGKYMKKAKALIGEVALLGEPPHPPFIGVCTRARTLELQRLQSPSASPSPASSSYRQLRSRRLQKTKPASPKRSPKSIAKARPCSRSVPKEAPENDRVEVSFGENALDCEARSSCRNARETTPCSPIKDSETVVTPGSTTRPTSSTAANGRTQSSVPRYIPTTDEIEEFFSSAEHLQQRSFAEKYNYDPVKDCPLPGRYEWVQLDSQAADN
ncbi:hypothetical protein J5N97_028809 [Dioscorea zingiberensis]|uniref:Cyclin-dependent kinase inhibitor n=1 Tax=Dioscorea zingiberensis TaxID=325984 RepID=A0A9D5C047_9LILI|nr:hypothetical protein J5N97_028809 [Dioscorea zingiberensis]